VAPQHAPHAAQGQSQRVAGAGERGQDARQPQHHSLHPRRRRPPRHGRPDQPGQRRHQHAPGGRCRIDQAVREAAELAHRGQGEDSPRREVDGGERHDAAGALERREGDPRRQPAQRAERAHQHPEPVGRVDLAAARIDRHRTGTHDDQRNRAPRLAHPRLHLEHRAVQRVGEPLADVEPVLVERTRVVARDRRGTDEHERFEAAAAVGERQQALHGPHVVHRGAFDVASRAGTEAQGVDEHRRLADHPIRHLAR
jgi:hypothetical protein